METGIVYWGYIRIMERKMEARVLYYVGLYRGSTVNCAEADLPKCLAKLGWGSSCNWSRGDQRIPR